MQNATLLYKIFSDAIVVDFDLSLWDKKFRLCVLADHLDYIGNRLPVVSVDFHEPSSISVEFNHRSVELDEASQHFQWNIGGIEIERSARQFDMVLSGAGYSPDLRLTCSRVEVIYLDLFELDRVFPGWNDPFAPLARPGLEKLFGMF